MAQRLIETQYIIGMEQPLMEEGGGEMREEGGGMGGIRLIIITCMPL